MLPDDALVDQAAAVVEVEVTSVDPAPLVGQPATDSLVEIRRVLKGEVPGSRAGGPGAGAASSADGLGLKIWGAPRFAEKEPPSSSSAPPRTAPTASSS